VNRELNIPFSAMSKPALAEKCQELTDELERARGGLSDSMGRNAELRYSNTKLVRVQRKAKGVVDRKSKELIRRSAWSSVLSNFVALGIVVPASLQSGEFTPFLLLSGVTSAVLTPLQTYLQKRNEEI